MNAAARKLYEELGPMLFARANRVLANDRAAEEVTLAVVDELSKLGKLSRLQLARRGRELVKHHCALRGRSIFDSVSPGLDPPK